MIAATDQGLLVTRFHYSNVVHPVETTITGMTRDGTLLIEDGEVTHPVREPLVSRNRSWRRSQTPWPSATRRSSRASSSLRESRVPAGLRVEGFHFSGRSDHRAAGKFRSGLALGFLARSPDTEVTRHAGRRHHAHRREDGQPDDMSAHVGKNMRLYGIHRQGPGRHEAPRYRHRARHRQPGRGRRRPARRPCRTRYDPPDLETCSSKTDISEAAEYMVTWNIRHLPVTDKARNAGASSRSATLTRWAAKELSGGHEMPDIVWSHTALEGVPSSACSGGETEGAQPPAAPNGLGCSERAELGDVPREQQRVGPDQRSSPAGRLSASRAGGTSGAGTSLGTP